MKNRLFVLLVILTLASCQTSLPTEAPASSFKSKKGMIKVTILYPKTDSATFDMDYYQNKHFPLLEKLLGDSLKFTEIDKGIAGRTPEDPIPYAAIGYLYFDKVSAYKNSFGPHAQEIRDDIKKYTNIVPVVQISEVVK